MLPTFPCSAGIQLAVSRRTHQLAPLRESNIVAPVFLNYYLATNEYINLLQGEKGKESPV
jgi:hypothetical protein